MNLERLKEEQLKLSRKVSLKDGFKEIATLGGADCAFFSNKIVAGIVVCDKEMNIIEKAFSIIDVKMPYIPGFLFYREGPALADAYSKLEKKPTVIIYGGNGILHPLRIGAASQLGVLLDQPTIGVAKALLTGKNEDGKILVGNEIRGMEVKTREFARPLYVSPGHKISMDRSVEIIQNSLRPPHKLPEPLHLAHKFANQVKDEMMGKE